MLYLCDDQSLLKAVKMGRWRRKSDVSRSARRSYFTGCNQRAPKKNNSRSSDVSGQGESASRRTCKWRSQHSSRQGYFRGYFKQRCSLGQIELFSHGKSLAGKEIRWAMKIKSRRGRRGCGRRLDEDQQKRRCASTGIVWQELGNRSANKDDESM